MINYGRGICSVEGCNNFAKSRTWCPKHYMRWHTHGDPTIARFIPAPAGAPAQFIVDTALLSTNECVPWPFARNNEGYGQINIPGTTLKKLAHRAVCEQAYGPPPTERHVAAHSCGNGHLGCVNPRHLRWTTRQDNCADTILHGHSTRGEKSVNAKINATQAKEIYFRVHAGERQQKLADEYGIGQTAVSHIKRGKNWGWLTGAGLIGVSPRELESEHA